MHVGTDRDEDDAVDHFGWMVGQWPNVLVGVHCFLKGFDDNPALLDADCQVQKVDRAGWLYKNPGESTKEDDALLELVPEGALMVSNPDCKDDIKEIKEEE